MKTCWWKSFFFFSKTKLLALAQLCGNFHSHKYLLYSLTRCTKVRMDHFNIPVAKKHHRYKNIDYAAAFHMVRFIYKSQCSCFQLREYLPFVQSLQQVLYLLTSSCNICHYSLLNPMLIYLNYQKRFTKYYEICKFTVPLFP